jgi:hypothetical protein
MHASPSAALLDPTGAIGRLYDARTTPHIFVIDPAGKLIYQGAIDDQPTPDPASLKVADNYLNDALNAAMAGKPVECGRHQAIARLHGARVCLFRDLRRFATPKSGISTVCRNEIPSPIRALNAQASVRRWSLQEGR